jgi:ATP-dependent Lhr-like helicase
LAAFDRLHPHLRHAIVHDLGWKSLRPVQDLTIEAVLDGDNTIVLAPTAGGKTEAAVFPLLSRILTEEPPPVAILYVCPIRALLNNLEERVQHYARMVGLDAFKWHGDVSDSVKRRFREEPAHLLMTTPESLEVMLISARTDARTLFRGLSAVVVDEIHAFAGDDRGAHLVALLERLTVFCGRDFQRIGLSATVGNPELISKWLQGSSKRPSRVVDPPRAEAKRDLHVDFQEEIEGVAGAISERIRGRKSLVFVESRSMAERIAHATSRSGAEVFVHHSSVSRADRAAAESRFVRGSNVAIVCTSTMELGIDVGDLDQIIQVDAPSTVASFLQRLGRTGRRPGTRPMCTFVCRTSESLMQGVALLRLAESRWIEDVQPPKHALHVLAHQVLALTLQETGVSRHRLLPWVHAAWPFSGISDGDANELLETMLSKDILYEADGILSLGRRGEALYGRKNFFELYAVFSAPPVMRVMHGREEVGFVEAQFASLQPAEGSVLCFRLAGRAWQVVRAEWSKGILRVRPAEHGRVPNWLGPPHLLSEKLCAAMRDILSVPGKEAEWATKAAAIELTSLRESYGEFLEPGATPLESYEDGVRWHTFAGGRVNHLLAAGLELHSGRRWIAGNLSLRCVDGTLGQASQAISALPTTDWDALAVTVARRLARGTLTKFQPCLPKAAEEQLLVDRLLDLSATRAIVQQGPRPPSTSGGTPAASVSHPRQRRGGD